MAAAAAVEEEQVRHLLNLHQNKASLSHVNNNNNNNNNN